MWLETNRRCNNCRNFLSALKVDAEPGMWKKTAAVLLCPLCDNSADPASRALINELLFWVRRDTL